MRILVSSTPEQSHLAPQMPLALELQRRGHEVLVACGASVGEYPRQLGIATVAAGLDLDPNRLGAGLGVRPPPDLKPEDIERWARRAVFVETFAAALAPDLRRIADDWRPDVMMRDRSEYAAWVVGEAVGVPVVTLTFGRLPDPADELEGAGDALEALRQAQGLSSDAELATLYAGPVLVPAPPSYLDPTIPVLPSVVLVQPMLHDTVGFPELPAWMNDLGARSVVYVTMGNIVNRESTFRRFLDALADEPLDLIVTVGRSIDPTTFEPLPANVHVEQYIANSLVIPRVDAVVCHAGFNTVMGALQCGRPLVLAPRAADQPVHAQRCAALGVGRIVTGRDPDEIRSATHAVLADPAYRDAARRIEHELEVLPDIHASADIVERTAA